MSIVSDNTAKIDEYVDKAWKSRRRDDIIPPLLHQASDYTFSGIAYSGLCDYNEEEHLYLAKLLQRIKRSQQDGSTFSFNQYMRTTTNPNVASEWIFDWDSISTRAILTEYGKNGYSMYFELKLTAPSDVKSMSMFHNGEEQVLVGNQARFQVLSLEQKTAKEFFDEEMEDGSLRIDALMTRNDMAQQIAKEAIQLIQREVYVVVLMQVV